MQLGTQEYMVIGVGLAILVFILIVVFLLLKERRTSKDLKADLPDDILVEEIPNDTMDDDMFGDDSPNYPLSDLIPDDEDDIPTTVSQKSLVKDNPDTPFNEASIHSTEQARSPLPFKSRVQRARDGEI